MDDFGDPVSVNTDPTLPHDRSAEEAVLGSVLIDPESYFDVSQVIRPEDFYIVRNRWIWEVFQNLNERRTPIDYLTVLNELEQRGHLFDAGGSAYVTSLINQTPTALHAVSYAHIIEQTALRRRMLTAANEMAKMAFDSTKDIDTIIGEAEKGVFGLSERRLTRDLQPIQTVLSEYYDRISELSARDEDINGVPTELKYIDDLLGGLQKSDLIIVAGRPGVGKTGFMLTIARNAAMKHKKHVAFFSLEMSAEQLVQRLISQETGIESQRLRSGKLRDDEWPLFTHSMDVLSNAPIWLDDTPALTPLQLRTKCRRLDMEHKIDLIMVDYLQLMTGEVRNDNRVQEVSHISRNLKVLARELKVPVLAGAQLSRAVEQRADKRPMLSDLRESGSLEQDADIVMFIHRPDAMEKDSPRKNVAEIIVGKHRNGPTHPGIELIFRENLARFDNAASASQVYSEPPVRKNA